MIVLGITGSPKKDGFTNLLLNKALEGAKCGGALTEKIEVKDLHFKPCQECGGCEKTGICILDDDAKVVYEKIAKADAIIIASPVYFTSVTAQLKAVIDRCQAYWIRKYVLKDSAEGKRDKKGFFICISGKEKEEYFKNSKQIIKAFFAALNIEYMHELYIGGMNEVLPDSPKIKQAILKSFETGLSLTQQ